jgi:hypothetical protein
MASTSAWFRRKVRRYGRMLGRGAALTVSSLAGWLAEHAADVAAADDSGLQAFVDAVQHAASRVARAEVSDAQAIGALLARREVRRFLSRSPRRSRVRSPGRP